MGHQSEKLHALVAVSVNGGNACLMGVWPKTTSPQDAWGRELEACGSTHLGDLGLEYPKEAGLWLWHGYLYYPGPEWYGSWISIPLTPLTKYLDNYRV